MADNILDYDVQDLPVDMVEMDKNQPRHILDVNGISMRALKRSVEKRGIQQPITVTRLEPNRYMIIDGHRRFNCAKVLKHETVRCLIYPELSKAELESRRFDIQNIRRAWKPVERSDALYQIKIESGFQTIKELAEHIGASESSVAESLGLRDQQMNFLTRLAKYELSESFQIEFVRLKRHLRKIAGIEVDEIIDNILTRIQNEKITNSKELRVIKKGFIRATPNQEILANYLQNEDMTTRELDEQITKSGLSAELQQVIDLLSKKHSKGNKFTKQEQDTLKYLKKLITEIL